MIIQTKLKKPLKKCQETFRLLSTKQDTSQPLALHTQQQLDATTIYYYYYYPAIDLRGAKTKSSWCFSPMRTSRSVWRVSRINWLTHSCGARATGQQLFPQLLWAPAPPFGPLLLTATSAMMITVVVNLFKNYFNVLIVCCLFLWMPFSNNASTVPQSCILYSVTNVLIILKGPTLASFLNTFR